MGATFKKDHARVLVACSLYAVARWLLGRGRLSVVLGATAPLLLVYARLRETGWGKRELNSRVLWERLVVDAELTSDSGGGGCE